MNTELIQFYQENSKQFENKLIVLKNKLYLNSILRILVFLATCGLIYWFWSLGPQLLFVFIIGLIGFLFLVKRHLKLKYQSDFNQKLVDINTIEVAAQKKDFLSLESGEEFKDSEHEYCNDIDLFGRGSFFQYSNRTSLSNAKKTFATILKSNDTSKISLKQEAIKELSAQLSWRQDFWAEAELVELEISPKSIVTWLQDYKRFVPRFMLIIILLFSIISLVALVGFGAGFLPEGIAVIWFFVGLGITSLFLKKVNELSQKASRSLTTFQQYSKLLKRIESIDWQSKLLKDQLLVLQGTGKTASDEIHVFAKALNALDQRSNIFVSIFTNGFFLRDIYCAYQVEKWIATNSQHVDDWFRVVEYFDVMNSMANFAHNHPSYNYPTVDRNQMSVLKSKSLGHPLLREETRIDNDFSIDQQDFLIITGANMAGKSTFLRTVSLAIVMSNLGLPICSAEARYNPIKLVTSMRTSDSLSDDESYFFSELKRLRFVIDRIEAEDYFIILDEILKGTNSVDKAAGSKKFLERLVKTHSTGIIATHDLSLCETSKQFPEVKNYYFDAQIIDDELFFDYEFKEGICQNMNASFLLKKMDLI